MNEVIAWCAIIWLVFWISLGIIEVINKEDFVYAVYGIATGFFGWAGIILLAKVIPYFYIVTMTILSSD